MNFLNKNQIIQTYEKAQTIKELELAKQETRLDYNQLMSYYQGHVKAAFNLKRKLLNG